MPFGPRRILAALAAVVALGAAGCGSDEDKSIPPSSSDQLLAQLEGVRDQVESGECELAKSAALQFKSSVDGLPSDVPNDTKDDLNKLADNLIELADDPSQCDQEQGATGETGVAETDTSTTDESTTTSSTTTSTTEDTTTKPEEEAQPSEPQQTEPQGGSQGTQGSGNVGGDLGGNGGTSGSTGGVKPGGG